MIVYFDTSALIKLFVVERGSDAVRELAGNATLVSTSLVAFAEFHAGLARREREGSVGSVEVAIAQEELEHFWNRSTIVPVTESLVRNAAALARTHRLRGFDAVHLASAAVLATALPEEMIMLTADGPLLRAAASEGFSVGP